MIEVSKKNNVLIDQKDFSNASILYKLVNQSVADGISAIITPPSLSSFNY